MIATPALLEAIAATARAAGEAILAVVERGFEVETKSDQSPVTEADRAAEAIILTALARIAPGVPIIAEEEVAAGRIPPHEDTFFLVDALDGTKSFVAGGEDYSVNIGLIESGTPTLGAIYAPASGRLHAGLIGHGAWREDEHGRSPIAVRPRLAEPVALASKAHYNQATADYLAAFGMCAERAVGSSLKFCVLAEGGADLYPRLSPTSEWDTGAGHALLLAAGGRVDGPDGTPLRYRKPAFINRGFVASGGWQAPAVGPYLVEFGGGGELPAGV